MRTRNTLLTWASTRPCRSSPPIGRRTNSTTHLTWSWDPAKQSPTLTNTLMNKTSRRRMSLRTKTRGKFPLIFWTACPTRRRICCTKPSSMDSYATTKSPQLPGKRLQKWRPLIASMARVPGERRTRTKFSTRTGSQEALAKWTSPTTNITLTAG